MEHGVLFSFDLAKKKIIMRNGDKLAIFYVFLVCPVSLTRALALQDFKFLPGNTNSDI